ncbi:MAG: type 1 glutamine amidotransferase domain-containing protein [Deltaproteobacteria bacterium]|nr:type 1 glutamine amidotransferase domain-containing protein [Deltaproteobacteria bacterium]
MKTAALSLLVPLVFLSGCAGATKTKSADSAAASPGSKGKVLVVLSSADSLTLQGGKTHPTGTYLNELVVPLKALVDAGYEPVFANPKGNAPAIDPASDSPKHFGGDEARYHALKALLDAYPGFRKPKTFSEVLHEGLSDYAGLFAPGGHAPFEDLLRDRDLGNIFRNFHATGKPTALLCHAPVTLAAATSDPVAFAAALSTTKKSKRATRALAKTWPYKGYRMTVFSQAEEKVAEGSGLGGHVLFYPEAALRAAGGKVDNGPQFQSHVVVDNELITGQNPASDQALAKALVDALAAKTAERAR